MSERSAAERFAAAGPWQTRFVLDGQPLGGTLDYEPDLGPGGRIHLFQEWLGAPPTILELGSFEGAHTLMLAAPDHVERVVGLDGRVANIRRAELAAELLGRGNIEFRQADLDNVDLTVHGRFDAVFCAGVLYHVREPWRLLHQIAAVSDRLFLDTHYAAAAEEQRNGFDGRGVAEGGYGDPLSGLGRTSFWLTLPALRRAIEQAGFTIEHEQDFPDWEGGPRIHLGCRRRG